MVGRVPCSKRTRQHCGLGVRVPPSCDGTVDLTNFCARGKPNGEKWRLIHPLIPENPCHFVLRLPSARTNSKITYRKWTARIFLDHHATEKKHNPRSNTQNIFLVHSHFPKAPISASRFLSAPPFLINIHVVASSTTSLKTQFDTFLQELREIL